MNPRSEIRADILGKLLVIQDTLDVLPDAATTAAFLNRALREIPGVLSVHLRVDGKIFPPTDEISPLCEFKGSEIGLCANCLIGSSRVTCLPLRTARHSFGTLILRLGSESEFVPYLSFVQNISNVVATTFETREYIRELDAARVNLEAQVAERTRELTNEIVERKAAERALASEATNLAALLDTASDGIHILSEDGKLMQFSHSFASMLGYSDTEIRGMSVQDWDAQIPKCQLLERLHGLIKTPGIFQTQHRRKDGSIIDVEINGKGVSIDGTNYLYASSRDITERKRAEVKLQESELRFRTIVEQSPIGVVCSRDGVTQAVNDAYLEMFGYASASEVCGQPQINRIAPQCRSDVKRRIRLRREGKSVESAYETTGQRKDGSQFPLYISAKRIVLNDGPATFAFLIDLSERKKAETVLKRLAAIVQFSADAIIGMDMNSLITSWNPGAEQIFGYSQEDVIGKPVAILAPAEKKDESKRLIQSLTHGDTSIGVETQRVRKDGKRIEIEYRLSPIRNSEGQSIGVSAIARDITEKRRLERTFNTLSHCNIVLIHATNELNLLKDVCRVIVDIGGYGFAWVGFPDQDPLHIVRPVAHYGLSDSDLLQITAIRSDTDHDQSPVGIAYRTGAIQVSQNLREQSSTPPWRCAAVALGYQAGIALPLKCASGALGVLEIYSREPDAFDPEEVNLLQELASDLEFGVETLRTRIDRDRIAFENQQHEEILRSSLEDTIKAIADTIETRDPYTSGHQRRVGELAVAIARELGIPELTIRGIELAASIHDLGKISIPSEILCKPAKLNNIELMLLKGHVQCGYDILKDIKFPWPIATMVLQHHERLDGSGYPHGLKGDEMLLESKILMVADVVEAMMSHRPYRAGLGVERALQEIERGRGTSYDASVVDACIRIIRENRFAFTS